MNVEMIIKFCSIIMQCKKSCMRATLDFFFLKIFFRIRIPRWHFNMSCKVTWWHRGKNNSHLFRFIHHVRNQNVILRKKMLRKRYKTIFTVPRHCRCSFQQVLSHWVVWLLRCGSRKPKKFQISATVLYIHISHLKKCKKFVLRFKKKLKCRVLIHANTSEFYVYEIPYSKKIFFLFHWCNW